MPEAPTTGDECGGTRLPSWVHSLAWGAIVMVALALAVISRSGRDRNVWEGWRESRELRRPGYAERVYINEVFRTRANTWSNLAFVLVGLYGIAIGWHDLRHPSPGGAGYLVQTPALSLTFGLACCFLGAGSGLFHASLTRFGQQMDVAAMYPPLLALIAVTLGRWIPCLPRGGHRRSLPTWPIWIALVGVASVLLFLYKWSMSSLNVLSTLIACVALCAVPDRRKLDLRWLGWSGAALIAAVICRQLDIAGRFTGPDAWLQGHALWHLLTGLSLGCMYFYHRSEMTIPLGRAALETTSTICAWMPRPFKSFATVSRWPRNAMANPLPSPSKVKFGWISQGQAWKPKDRLADLAAKPHNNKKDTHYARLESAGLSGSRPWSDDRSAGASRAGRRVSRCGTEARGGGRNDGA